MASFTPHSSHCYGILKKKGDLHRRSIQPKSTEKETDNEPPSHSEEEGKGKNGTNDTALIARPFPEKKRPRTSPPSARSPSLTRHKTERRKKLRKKKKKKKQPTIARPQSSSSAPSVGGKERHRVLPTASAIHIVKKETCGGRYYTRGKGGKKGKKTSI